MSAVRVQRKRTKGWRMPDNTVYVGRGTIWGNPYKVTSALVNGFYVDGEVFPGEPQHWWAPTKRDALEIAVNQYLVACAWGVEKRTEIREALSGKDLACWCPLDQPCHADVLLELANYRKHPVIESDKEAGMIPEDAVKAVENFVADRFKWESPLLPELARDIVTASAPHIRAQALEDAADMVRDKDHRKSLHADDYNIGWCHALNEVEHRLRARAVTERETL